MSELNVNELKEWCINQIKIITDAAPEEKEKLFEVFHEKLSNELEGVDYMEYENGVVCDKYINFDSNCGLSMISAYQSLEKLSKYMESNELANAINALSEDGSREEYWDDLVDEEYNFEGTPEEVTETIVSVLDPWVGEEEFRKEMIK